MKIDKLFIALSLIVGLSSCSNWLDLEPKDTTTDTDLFTTGDGYRIALNGIYAQMAEASLYGKELSWGLVDVMAQMYMSHKISGIQGYNHASEYQYEDKDVKPMIEAIWSKAYNSVANCNNIIQRIETESASKFVEGETERMLIEGETLALRAYLHLDMLRLFAPSMMKDDGKPYIPYVTTYPCTFQPYSTNSEVLDKAIQDLKKAKTLLEPYEMANIKMMTTRKRMENAEGPSDLFFAFRGYRMNYYAICALLARVYNYAGMHQEAFDEAGMVIEAKSEGYKCFTTTLSSDVANGNIKLYDDIVFCLADQHLWTNYEPYHLTETSLVLSAWDILDFFDSESDTRSRLVQQMNNNVYNIRNVKNDRKLALFAKDMIPMIRLGEMYYIRAEYYNSKKDIINAKVELEKLRADYNCPPDKLGDNIEQEIIDEARREYLGEGQLFYYYKKFTIYPTSNKEDAQFVLPRPDNENL